jgi:hypothetical protein
MRMGLGSETHRFCIELEADGAGESRDEVLLEILLFGGGEDEEVYGVHDPDPTFLKSEAGAKEGRPRKSDAVLQDERRKGKEERRTSTRGPIRSSSSVVGEPRGW